MFLRLDSYEKLLLQRSPELRAYRDYDKEYADKHSGSKGIYRPYKLVMQPEGEVEQPFCEKHTKSAEYDSAAEYKEITAPQILAKRYDRRGDKARYTYAG